MSDATFGYTAFGPDDQQDAARRHPSCDLSDWAATRDLNFRGQVRPSAFVSVLPQWPEHLINVCTGTFPGDRFGLVAHRLYELETWEGDIRLPGDYWGSTFTTRRSLKSFLNLTTDESKGPFDGNRVFAPTTTVAVRAPQAALFPRILIRNDGRLPFIDSPKLAAYGLPHLRSSGSRFVDDDLLAAFATAVAPVLSMLREPFVQFEYSHTAIALTVNGYRCDPAYLDWMMQAGSALADALAELAGRRWPTPTPPDFEAGWGAPDVDAQPVGFPRHGSEWDEAYDQSAGKLTMTREDPAQFHRHLPDSPIPGLADGVLKGQVGGSPVRLSWHVQGGPVSGWVRAAATFPVPGSVPEGPLGGRWDEATGMNVEIHDGIAYTWVRQRVHGRLNSAELLATTAQLHRQIVGGEASP